MINREQLVRRYNPLLCKADFRSPLTLGNGDFAFTADITGLQTLYGEYEEACPVLTMASDFRHIAPYEGGEARITETSYECFGRTYKYPVKCFEGEEKAYKWLRENPHRHNLFRLSFEYKGKTICSGDITGIEQKLDLYTGILSSRFGLPERVSVETVVGDGMTLGVKVESVLLRKGLKVKLSFPYADSSICGGNFDSADSHFTMLKNMGISRGQTDILVKRKQDNQEFYVRVNGLFSAEFPGNHEIILSGSDERSRALRFCVSVSEREEDLKEITYREVRDCSLRRFYAFWNSGAMIDVSDSADPRASELERRIILSMYLCFVQATSVLPPQETGLTCNSWYGKFHLEMHPVHSAWFALYGRGNLLEKSLGYYFSILEKAKADAARNGFKGARWPKMTDASGTNSPSEIAPLLIWQQPHIIYMTELLRLARYSDKRSEVPDISEEEFIRKYAVLISETADFMEDYLAEDPEGGLFLPPPLYSVQEKGDPEKITNPPFEADYWKFGLKTAYEMLSKAGLAKESWLNAAERIKAIAPVGGLLPAYEGCKDTYSLLNMDHPSMLYSPGYVGSVFDREVLEKSLAEFEKTWDYGSLWGWDFAFLAMTLAKLGRYDEAFDMLLCKTEKNTYGAAGNNVQGTRKDLPLYLPGNGSLLLAMSAMKSTDKWFVETEGLQEYPF